LFDHIIQWYYKHIHCKTRHFDVEKYFFEMYAINMYCTFMKYKAQLLLHSYWVIKYKLLIIYYFKYLLQIYTRLCVFKTKRKTVENRVKRSQDKKKMCFHNEYILQQWSFDIFQFKIMHFIYTLSFSCLCNLRYKVTRDRIDVILLYA